jgi:TRAP-type C4-dicarboxylate transport system permease small subunit
MRALAWWARLAAALWLGWLIADNLPGAWPLIAVVLMGACMTLTHYLIITTPTKGKDHVVSDKELDDPQGPRPDSG